MPFAAEDFETAPSRPDDSVPVQVGLWTLALLGVGLYAYWEIVQGIALTGVTYVLGGAIWVLLVLLAARLTNGWDAAAFRNLAIGGILLAVLFLFSWTPVKPFQVRLAKVEKGMTYEEVIDTMSPYEPSGHGSTNNQRWYYRPAPASKRFAHHSGTIVFRKGKVTDVGYSAGL